MNIKKIAAVDRIEVLQNGLVQVRTRTSILEDGVQISATYHRHVIAPGDNYSEEDARVQAICAAVHTHDLIETHKAATAA